VRLWRQPPDWLWVWLVLLGLLYLVHMVFTYEEWRWHLAVLAFAAALAYWDTRQRRSQKADR
jgi:hypothetical protein